MQSKSRISHDAAQVLFERMCEHEVRAAKATRDAQTAMANATVAVAQANQATIARNKLAAELDELAPEDFTGLPVNAAATASRPLSRFDKYRPLPFPPSRQDSHTEAPPMPGVDF